MVPTRPAEVSAASGPGPAWTPWSRRCAARSNTSFPTIQGEHLERVVVTGGAALTSGLVERIRAGAPCARDAGHGGSQAVASQLKLSDEQMQEASVRWATAVGLALLEDGTRAGPVAFTRRDKGTPPCPTGAARVGGRVMAVALGLGVVSYSGAQTASHVKAQIVNDNTQALARAG